MAARGLKELLEELDADEYGYRVRFALGLPIVVDDLDRWTSLRSLEVYVRSHEAWVSWISEPDPVDEVDWVTRCGRMAFWSDPFAVAWEFVDWQIARRLKPSDDDWEPGKYEPVEPDDDDYREYEYEPDDL